MTLCGCFGGEGASSDGYLNEYFYEYFYSLTYKNNVLQRVGAFMALTEVCGLPMLLSSCSMSPRDLYNAGSQ